MKWIFSYIKRELYDYKFASNKAKYLGQCAVATLVIFIILIALNALQFVGIIASIGATLFIVFTSPHSELSRSKYIIGGYVLAITFGGLFGWCSGLIHDHMIPFIVDYRFIIFGTLALGFTVFGMVITNTEHPPAASLALGFVLDETTMRAVIVTLFALFVILSYRHIYREYMIDLI